MLPLKALQFAIGEMISPISWRITAILMNGLEVMAKAKFQISLGSSGVPESFIVDGKGVIRYQHIGPIERSEMPLILSKLEQAR